jgi:ABC-type nitrate/sulfonate/bicarbonate transport system ATPase subunit
MTDIPSNSVRFVKLHLNNYGIFLGSNELNFDHHRTLIVGMGGTGKTTIVNTLAQLGPATGVEANIHADPPEMSVEVVTKGNRNLIKEYSSVIFLSEELKELPMPDQEAIRTEAWETLQTMLHRKYWNVDTHKDFIPQTMAAGERVCFGYAYAFAVRKALNLDLPVVLDSPYTRLDSELRQRVSSFLKDQPCQQILLGGVSEFNEKDKPHYVLDYTKDYSTVIKAVSNDG